MDPSGAAGGRRNKRRGNRSGQGQGQGQGGQGRKRRKRKRPGGGRGGRGDTIDRLPPTHKDDSSVLGGRQLATDQQENELNGPPDGFGLFCAYYLGVTPDDRYSKPSLDETARRYQMAPAAVKDLLTEHRLDTETVSKSRFDLEGAKLDVRLAPEGISRIEIAREQYGYYLEALESLG